MDKKLINPGVVVEGTRKLPIFIEIEWHNGKLSLTGVLAPRSNGDADTCGQLDEMLAGLSENQLIFNAGWDFALFTKLLAAWDKWHLNDMHAACEHQEALGWHTERLDPNQPARTYGKFYPGQTMDSWNLKMWHHAPHGYMGVPCPVCGYKLGYGWTARKVPTDVLEFLFGLPDSKVNMPGRWGNPYRSGWQTLAK